MKTRGEQVFTEALAENIEQYEHICIEESIFESFHDPDLDKVWFTKQESPKFAPEEVQMFTFDCRLERLCLATGMQPHFKDNIYSFKINETEEISIPSRCEEFRPHPSPLRNQKYAEQFIREFNKLPQFQSLPQEKKNLSIIPKHKRNRQRALGLGALKDESVISIIQNSIEKLSHITEKNSEIEASDFDSHMNQMADTLRTIYSALKGPQVAFSVSQKKDMQSALIWQCHKLIALDQKNTCRESIYKTTENGNQIKGEENSLSKSLLDTLVFKIDAANIILIILNECDENQILLYGDCIKVIVQYIRLLVAVLQTRIRISSLTESTSENTVTTFLQIVDSFSTLISRLAKFVLWGNLDESIISSMEYLAIAIIFDQVNDQVADGLSFSRIQTEMCTLLTHIFNTYPEQRLFILQETMNNLLSNAAEGITRRGLLPSGDKIRHSTLLLVSFIQTVDPIPGVEMPKKVSLCVASRAHDLLDISMESVASALSTSTKIAGYLASNLMASLAIHQSFLLSIYEELTLILFNQQWPGSVLLLEALVNALLLDIISGESCQEISWVALNKIVSLLLRLAQTHGCELGQGIRPENYFTGNDVAHMRSIFCSERPGWGSMCQRFLKLRFISIMLPTLERLKSPSNLGGMPSNVDIKCCDEFESLFQELCAGLVHNCSESSNEQIFSDEYTKFIFSHVIVPIFETVLHEIFKRMNNSGYNDTMKVMKSIKIFTDIEPKLLQSPLFQKTISDSLQSNSAHVRNSVLDLVAQCISMPTGATDLYCKPICELMADKSSTVRKTVLKLIMKIFPSVNSAQGRRIIACTIFQGILDRSESVVELSSQYLEQIWLDRQEMTIAQAKETQAAEIVIDILQTLQRNSGHKSKFKEWLLQVVQKNPHSRKSVRSIIDATQSLMIDKAHEPQTLRTASLFLAVVAKVDGSLMNVTDLRSLVPYIEMLDRDDDPELVYQIMKVFSHVLQTLKSLPLQFGQILQLTLLRFLGKYKPDCLEYAVASLWRVSDLIKSFEKINNAVMYCLKSLRLWAMEFQNKDTPHLVNTLRLVSLMAKYCDFETSRTNFIHSTLKMMILESVLSMISRYILVFSGTQFTNSVRCASMTGILQIGSMHHFILMSDSVLKLLDDAFRNGDPKIVIEVVEGLDRLLDTEANASKRSYQKKQDFQSHSDFADKEIGATLIQLYGQNVLGTCLLCDHLLTRASISFIKNALTLGYMRPNECISTIIALELDFDKTVSNLSISLHLSLLERYEELCYSNYVDSFNKAAQHYKKLHGMNETAPASDFLNLQFQLVSSSPALREKLTRAIVNVLRQSTVDQELSNLYTIQFVACSAAQTRFMAYSDLIIIVQGIRETITKQGFDLMEILCANYNQATNVLHAVKILSLLALFNHLTRKYSMTNARKSNRNLGKPPKADLSMQFELEFLASQQLLENEELQKNVREKFEAAMQEYC